MSHEHYPSRAFRSFIWLTGIILPTYCVLLEGILGICRSVRFNPLPSPVHALLILLISLVSLLSLKALKKGDLRHPRLVSLLLGVSLAISALYSLCFVPLLPAGVVLCAYSVVGLFMPLLIVFPIFGPILALISQVWILLRLRAAFPTSKTAMSISSVLGVFLGLLVIAAMEAPTVVTTVALERLEERHLDTRSLRTLRHYGDPSLVLELAYYGGTSRGGIFSFLYSYLTNIPSAGVAGAFMRGPNTLVYDHVAAQRIYYQLTGTPYNEVSPPSNGPWSSTWFWDSDQGQQLVGGKVPGLFQTQSQIQGSIDANAGLAYFEWTLEFENRGEFPQEARTEIQLPPESLVSRATLWVNGEEQEAAFAPRAQAVRAYTNVVRRQRDPLLVTHAGKDRALIQCFPVPPKGGRMKIRIGVTAPLHLSNLQRAELYIPLMVQRNFISDENFRSDVWFESKQSLKSSLPALHTEQFGGGYAVRGSLGASQLATISAARSPETLRHYATDTLEKNWVFQEIRTQERKSPPHLVLVIDGSASMQNQGDRVATLLENLFSNELADTQFAALIAGDSIQTIYDQFVPARPENIAKLVGALRRQTFVGGADNGEALLAAWDLATRNPGTNILWLHGPQPIEFDSFAILRSRFERRKNGPVLLGMPLEASPDAVAKTIGSLAGYQPLHPSQLLDREELASIILAGRRLYRALGHSAQEPTDAVRTSDHLTRLWAGVTVQELLDTGKANDREAAANLASRYSILTEVSGAVALENDSQYQQNGLSKPGFGLVPSVPEPSTYLFLILLLLTLIAQAQCGRLKNRGSRPDHVLGGCGE